jgi:hypothetical protein
MILCRLCELSAAISVGNALEDKVGNVRTYAYIRVVGDEETIRELQHRTDVAGAEIRKLKAKKRNELLWSWVTAKAYVDSENPENDLRALLHRYRSTFPSIKSYSGKDVKVFFEVVMEHKPHDKPVGLYLSAETISLLCELGASLDNDVSYQPLEQGG